MKKTIIIAALAIMTAAFPATAQVKIGPKAGLSASWMPNTKLNENWFGVISVRDKALPHNSFYAGVSAEYLIGESFVAQMELLYVGKGHSDRNYRMGKESPWTEKYNLDLGYVQVPIYAGYSFYDNSISIMVGPEFGFNVLARTTITQKDVVNPEKNDVVTKNDVKDTVRPFNIGLGLQISYQFWEGMGFDAKVSWGLNRTFRDGMNASGNLSPEVKIDPGRNLSMQIGLFYKFAL